MTFRPVHATLGRPAPPMKGQVAIVTSDTPPRVLAEVHGS